MSNKTVIVHKHKHSYPGGISLGAVLAVLASWSVNHSVLFAVVHAVCGWFYVVYWLFVYGSKVSP